jgi:predicted DNA-binding transcriptional regulator YafY
MANFKTINRYARILQKLRQGSFPTLDQIIDYLSTDEVAISQRSVERDISILRTEFKIDIAFSRTEKGYYIDNPNELNDEGLMNLIELSQTIPLFDPNRNKDKTKYIFFQKENQLKGTEYLSPILEAIDKKVCLTITYQAFYTDIATVKNIQPYMLREFDHRWYVYGIDVSLDDFRLLALDRIHNCELTTTKFKAKNITLEEVFANRIGVSELQGTAEKLVLKFTNDQAKYIQTLPLHLSQEEIKTDVSHTWFSYYLVFNYELRQQILKHGPNVEVVSPEHYRKHIAELLAKSNNLYRK